MVYPLVYPRWPTNEKGLASANLPTPVIIGRCERIRTFDPLHPMQVRYQAAPHTDEAASIALPDCNFACALETRPQQIPKFNQFASQQLQSLLRQRSGR